MPSQGIVTKAILTSAEPQLFVADIGAACDFFVEKLGFGIVFKYGEPPYYGQVQRDGARLNLRCVGQPVIDNSLREQKELLSVTIMVDDVKRLYLEYQAAGAAFAQPLSKKPWGALDFIVRDPDGNLLLFAGSGE